MDRRGDADDRLADAEPLNEPAGIAALEARLEELEDIAGSLGDIPEEELASTLERAVALLREINAGIEARMHNAGENAEKAGRLLEGIDLTPFDTAMKELSPMEPATPRAASEEHDESTKGDSP